MGFTRQFKALAKITAFFAAAWGAAGALIGALGGVSVAGGMVAAAYTLGIIYACVGGVTGAVTALLIGRAESGRNVGELPTWRIALWALLGGITPAIYFGSMGAVFFGASATEVIGLLAAGLGSGGVAAIISGSAFATAKRSALSEKDTPQELRS